MTWEQRPLLYAVVALCASMTNVSADHREYGNEFGIAIPHEPISRIENWEPTSFQINCGLRKPPFQPSDLDASCIDRAMKGTLERLFTDAALDQFALGFPSPSGLGPVVNSAASAPGSDVTARAVRLFADDAKCLGPYACVHLFEPSTVDIDDICHAEGDASIFLSPKDLSALPEYLHGMVAAHELYHTVQHSIESPASKQSPYARTWVCDPPKWVVEAQAVAASNVYVRAWHPNFYPPDPKQPFGRYLVGLRPYNLPLDYEFEETDRPEYDPTAYATASFWMHLTDIYHGGVPKFHEYGKIPRPVTKNGRTGTWLQWLDSALNADPAIATPLYRVYPGFLTHFAGQFEGTGIGHRYGMVNWLMEAFGLCWEAVVSPSKPFVEIEINNLKPMAGHCLFVTIKGLEEGDAATVKIGAIANSASTEDKELVDSLHLGFVRSDDKTKFNCALLAREEKPPPGMAECQREPVTGVIGEVTPGERYVTEDGAAIVSQPQDSRQAARTWFASGPHRPHSNSKVGISNLYVISLVPPEPTPKAISGLKRKTFTLSIGLELSRGTIGSASTPGEDGVHDEVESQQIVAAMGNKALASDMLVPASTGWIDGNGIGEMLGEDTLGLMANVMAAGRDMAGSLPEAPGLGAEFGTKSVFGFAEAKIAPLGDPTGEVSIEPTRQFSVIEIEPIPPGATGQFPVSVSGGDPKSGITYLTVEEGDATLTILENSETVFRAKVAGTLCGIDAGGTAEAATRLMTSIFGKTPSSGPPTDAQMEALERGYKKIESKFAQTCSRNLDISAEISKPFAYLYRPETQLVAEETEGEELYNRYGPSRYFFEALASVASDSAGGQGGSGASIGGEVARPCDCSCGARQTSGAASCRPKCMSQWTLCPAEDSAAPKTAAKLESAPRPLTPTIEAQRKWFSRLVSDQGLSPEVERMLVDDFATMSDETRKYLIRRYRNGVE